MAIEEKRRHRRIEVRWPISILSQEGIIGGETRNISVDGVLLCSEKPLRVDETLFLSLRPPKHHAIEVTGKVIWSDLYGIDEQGTVRCMGICFVKISDIDRGFLDGLVSSHLDQ